LKEVNKITDFEIVQKIINNNDKHLYAIIYDRYANLVYSRCFSFSSTKAEAKDLTQDVFIKAYLKLNTFTEDVSFKSWLYTLTYRFCVNYINRNKERKIQQESDDIDDVNEMKFAISDEVLYDMEVKRLEKSLKLMSPENRMILLLKYQDDATIKELSLNLDIGESAVKMRLKRAKAKLVEVYNTF
jgi:RNA polymerase sigma-70 factor (ECF subfamily)